MKRITLIICLLTTALTFSQEKEKTKEFPGTTTEEYNYMTKGYKIQLSSGLDMKNGYSFDNLGTINKDNYGFNFQVLMRTEQNEMAGVLITAKSGVSGRTYYLALPFNNDELKLYFENDVKNWDESMTTAFAQAMSEVNSKLLINYFLKTKE